MKFYYNVVLISICFLFIKCDNEIANSDELKQIVADYNKKCPQMIDSETKFDGMSFIEPNTLVYKYTLVHLSKENVDTSQFKLLLWPGILSTIKISPEMKKLRDNSTIINYQYNDKNNKPIYTFKISPKNYN